MNTKSDLALIKSEIGTYEERKESKASFILSAAGFVVLLAIIFLGGVTAQ